MCGLRGRGLGDRLTEGVFFESWEVVGGLPISHGFKVFCGSGSLG